MRAHRHAISWAVWGALVGAAFPLAGAVVEAASHPEYGPGAAALLRAAGTPLFRIVCAAPVVLGLLSALVGQRQDRLVAVEEARREAFLKTASELFTAAQALLATVSSFSAPTAGTAASVRETTATMGQLGHTATQAALTAETVIGLARQGERASAEGKGAVEACVGELRKVADEVRALARRMEALDARMHEVFEAAAGVQLCGMPMKEICGANKLAGNTAALGAVLRLLGIEPEPLEAVIARQFRKKGEAVVAENVAIARRGYEFAGRSFVPLPFSAPRLERRRAILTGNQAIATARAKIAIAYRTALLRTPGLTVSSSAAIAMSRNCVSSTTICIGTQMPSTTAGRAVL